MLARPACPTGYATEHSQGRFPANQDRETKVTVKGPWPRRCYQVGRSSKSRRVHVAPKSSAVAAPSLLPPVPFGAKMASDGLSLPRPPARFDSATSRMDQRSHVNQRLRSGIRSWIHASRFVRTHVRPLHACYVSMRLSVRTSKPSSRRTSGLSHADVTRARYA